MRHHVDHTNQALHHFPTKLAAQHEHSAVNSISCRGGGTAPVAASRVPIHRIEWPEPAPPTPMVQWR